MKLRAYLVHLLTASGLIPMMLSVDAIWQSDAPPRAYLARRGDDY
jgi:hypothetical protein